MDYGFQMQLLCCEQGETFFEIETHLVAEHTARAGACAV